MARELLSLNNNDDFPASVLGTGITMKRKHATRPRVLLAVEDYELRALLKHLIEQLACTVVEVQQAHELLALLETDGDDAHPRFDLAVGDAQVLDESTLRRMAAFRSRPRSPPWMLIAGRCDARAHRAAQHLDPVAVIDRPFRPDSYISKIRELVRSQTRTETCVD